MLAECGSTLRWAKAQQGGFSGDVLTEMAAADEEETDERVQKLAKMMGVITED
jgi:hypothetical protein